MTISIIIPVYNVAPFLQACVDSLLAQSFADFEVLLIDDGSTDGSGRICDDLAGKDPRVVVLHKENGGVCSARNCGIDHARGEFIVFVDADDLVTDDYLEHLMESDADMVVLGSQKFGAKNDAEKPSRRNDFSIDSLAEHWNTPPVMNYLYCYSWAKRFRTRIIREQGIRFNETLFFQEDLHFNMRYYCHAETFTEMPYADYLYRIADITRDEKYKMSTANLIDHYGRLNEGFERLYAKIGAGALAFVRDNVNLRLMRKLYAFLMQDGITQKVFVRNIKLFREKEWVGYMMGLLKGKKEKRVMNEAIRFPLLTYWFEYRLQHALSSISNH